MNQENQPSSADIDQERLSFVTFRKKLENNDEDKSSITPKRPLLSRDRSGDACAEVSPLSDRNSRPERPVRVSLPITPLAAIEQNNQSPVSTVENCMFVISPPQAHRATMIDDEDHSYVPAYIHKTAKPAPSSTWKTSYPLHKLSSSTKANLEAPAPEVPQSPIVSFQPAIRPRVPFNLSSSSSVDKQTLAYAIWFNTLFTPVEFMAGQNNTTVNQSVATEGSSTKSFKALAESNRWYILRDRAREVFTRDIQPIAAKISADIDADHGRINPKADLNFSPRTVSRQALLTFISSFNRVWFRLAMEVLFPINIDNYQQMKLAIEQYLLQSTGQTTASSTDSAAKKTTAKVASAQIRLTIKNLILIILFLERAKLLRLIDNDPCLYARESQFKSTKESIDVFSRDFISSDTNLIRRLKLAGFEPVYRQTSLDEYNYLIATSENKLFDELKDGIRLTRCAQILLAPSNEQVARFDLSTKLKCPVVNLVHKLLNIDQAFELLQTYGRVNLTGISNKDVMNGNKSRTLELLWRVFITCYLPTHLSPIEKLQEEIAVLTENLGNFNCRQVEQQLISADLIPLQKQQIDFSPEVLLLIKWAQLLCSHYKFWLYDLQESFIDGRAFLYIISYYLPTLCDYSRDIKHLTTLATCQTREEHIQFNLELGQQQPPQSVNAYERNVKSNFRFLEECIKQFGSFSNDLVKYESYAKDVPDERCTIMILAMLAHDLLFANNLNNEGDFRHQSIFEELKEKYSIDDEPLIDEKKDVIASVDVAHVSTEAVSLLEDLTPPPIDKGPEEKSLKPSISSTTINILIEESTTTIHPLPIIPAEGILVDTEEDEGEQDTTNVTILSPPSSPEKQDWSFVEPPACVYDQTLSDSLYASLETMFTYQTPKRVTSSLSQSVLHTMNHDILDHLEPLPELNDPSDNEDEDSFNSARSGVTTMMDPRRASLVTQTTSLTFHDLAELEKTIESDAMKVNPDNTSLFLIDESTPSEADSVEMNKLDDSSFTDPVNSKMIKETLTLFLAHQQQTLENEESLGHPNDSTGQLPPHEQVSELIVKTEEERELYAVQLVQAHWRGHQVRAENERTHHPVVAILEKIRAHDPTQSSSLTLRERMMQIVQEYSESPSSSLTAYLHFLRDVEPIVACCLEIRYLIAQQGLLRLFFILMRCCNRSGPSAVLLSKVLSILHLFTVKRGLITPLIDKQEQVKDFIMLLLKYYQKNRSELFEQICSLLESIVNDEYGRKMLRSNRAFTDAIEYVYKRVFNKASAEDEKYRQQVRSTPKQSTGPQTRRATLLNQSSILYPTPKMMRPPAGQNENVFKKNLLAMEKFMKMFYHD